MKPCIALFSETENQNQITKNFFFFILLTGKI